MARYAPPTFNEGAAPGLSATIMQAIADGVKEAQDYTPSGVMYPYWGDTAPTGFLLIDGTTGLSQATYADLYAIAGPAGSGILSDAGGGLFDMPNWRGKMLIGEDATGPAATMGATFGAIDHTHTSTHTHAIGSLAIVDHPSHTHAGPSHTHTTSSHTHGGGSHTHGSGGTASAGSHGHGDSFSTGGASSTSSIQKGTGLAVTKANAHTHAVNGSVSSGGSHSHGGSGSTGSGSATTGSGGGAATGASGTANTGNPSATLAHPITGVTDTPSAASGAGNPPTAVVQWIVKI